MRVRNSAERVAQLTDELRVLETERDEAVKTAESCARTSVRLEEMIQLLERLALEKIKDGDEEGARQVLTEKASTREILERTNSRAQINYTLASKLADKIGSVQQRLVEQLGGASTGGSTAQPPRQQQQQQQPSLQEERRPAQAAGGDVSSSGGGGDFASSYAPRRPAWESSLEEARARIKQAEEAAAAEGRRTAWQARETIEEARERLRRQAVDSVQALMARYKRGEYVTEDELEWAQLEKRFIM
ncbi:hypothetical protein MNEG_7277 [Monoraphidium neglectum]|uniref:Uncharacterized protein n=1 Tax=Monoraphidium neglectum TaxID=145388 RepID=A0A0D2KZV8_9CHLO|nr:hypothetical protein MNEG_7277 [Monoraphidium neglectum]KIZ00689.1 hypothetical protein MNEG_7277 [Monoraphidium neglectum]|eukprot:XP_013899708.1 hypothetical protein MNEG_7277 [Monoraphidium neglectum]